MSRICLLLAVVLLTGCVSYPVMEFRGTAINIDGTGRIESEPRELGVQKSGTTGGRQFFALGFNENSEFRLTYPRGKSLASINSSSVKALLIRGASAENTYSSKEVELTGTMRIKFRDNNHFTIGVNLKSEGTNNVALQGKFLAYSVRQFEPMTYAAAIPMLFGFGEASLGPARVDTREGNMNLVREAILKLSKKRNPGASVDIHIVEANRCITFTRSSALVNPIGIRLSFPVDSKLEAALKAKMESICVDMGLNLNVAASRELSNPTVEMEPYFLSVDLNGKLADVSETMVTILQRLFGVTEKSRFQITE